MELPCIRCGDCLDACPAHLQPLQLLAQLRDGQLERAGEQGLLDCSECGACDLACPSAIPLSASFRDGKQALQQRRLELAFADAARQRHHARQLRLVREDDDQAVQREQRQVEASSVDAVAAALARARAKRQSKDGQGKDPEDPS